MSLRLNFLMSLYKFEKLSKFPGGSLRAWDPVHTYFHLDVRQSASPDETAVENALN